jgi:rhodanese-related sulfurtransferase
MGYTNVSSLAGGIASYQAAGLPVDQTSPPK